MKKNLLILFFLFSLNESRAQISHTLSPETVSYYNQTIEKLNPDAARFIQEAALGLDRRQFNFDSLYNSIRQNGSFQNYSSGDCHQLSLLILIRCSMIAEADLKRKVLQSGKGDQEDLKYENMEALLKRKSDLAEMVSVQMKKM